jgi:hypothetical protein
MPAPRRSAPRLPADLWTRLPPAAHDYIRDVLAGIPVELRVSRPRRTKLGDHRPPSAGLRRHRISVNDDLNPYAFLTTLLHEVAHAATWERYRLRVRRVRPHGAEWKREFGRILAPVVSTDVLPADVADALAAMMQNPVAATCSDRGLSLALARYDAADAGVVLVETLPPGTVFRLDGGRVFRLGTRLRSRFRCIEQRTGREYRMHPLSRVVPLGDAGDVANESGRGARA